MKFHLHPSVVEIFLNILTDLWNFCVRESRLTIPMIDIDEIINNTRDASTMYNPGDFLTQEYETETIEKGESALKTDVIKTELADLKDDEMQKNIENELLNSRSFQNFKYKIRKIKNMLETARENRFLESADSIAEITNICFAVLRKTTEFTSSNDFEINETPERKCSKLGCENLKYKMLIGKKIIETSQIHECAENFTKTVEICNLASKKKVIKTEYELLEEREKVQGKSEDYKNVIRPLRQQNEPPEMKSEFILEDASNFDQDNSDEQLYFHSLECSNKFFDTSLESDPVEDYRSQEIVNQTAELRWSNIKEDTKNGSETEPILEIRTKISKKPSFLRHLSERWRKIKLNHGSLKSKFKKKPRKEQ